MAVHLSFTDDAEAIGNFDPNGSFLRYRITGEGEHGHPLALSFGIPDLIGNYAAASATFEISATGGSTRMAAGVLASSADAPPVALVGDRVSGVNGAVFTRFLDPVSNGEPGAEGLAFVGQMRISGKTSPGIWMQRPVASLLDWVARSGTTAPGTDGSRFARFTSLAMLPTGSPVLWLH